MKILVIGAGAIGGYFGAVLARDGHSVTMLARGQQLQALRSRGVQIVGGPDEGTVPVNVVSDLNQIESPDLVLFAVKSYDTAEVCQNLRPALAVNSVVLELQNGVDRAEEIDHLLGSLDNVLAGTVYMEVRMESPGVIQYLSGARRIVFGEVNQPITSRVAQIRDTFIAAGINAEAYDDVSLELWRKFLLVCAANSLTALTKSPFGDIIGFPPGRQLVSDIISEAVTVGRHLGVNLGLDIVEKSMAFLDSMGPNLRSSMLRDIELNRLTEMDALNGYVVRQAEKFGLDVPLNRLIWTALALHNRSVGTATSEPRR